MTDKTAARATGIVGEAVGVVALALYSVTTAVSFAALVFAGPAAIGLPRGASTFVLASAIVTVFLGWRSRFDMAFGTVQDTAAIVLVPAVATIAAASSDDPVRDVLVVLGLSSALTGAVMWGIGRARLAGTVRFMPTTVVAGFLAGTGWLLTKGGFDVMTGRALELGDLDDLIGFDLARFWLPGAVLGTFIAVVPFVRWLSPVASSLMTILMTIGFFVVVGSSSSLDAVESGGWLLGPFPDGGSIGVIGSEIVDANWSAVGDASGSISVVVILSVIGVLLNLSGVQVIQGQRVDLDDELRSTGIANLLTAPIGGLVAYHALGDTALANRLGLVRRAAPVAVGVIVGAFAFLGGEVIGFLPRFAAGGLLIGAGLGLLIDWVRELRSTMWADRFVSVLIVAAIAFVGILEGIVVGVLAACLIFVVRYSRIDAVRLVSTGAQRRSVVERTPAQRATLEEFGGRLAIYELQGYLFFGSVSGVAEQIRDRLGRPGSPIDVVVIDFDRVSGIDSSAFAVLAEVASDSDAAGAKVIWSGLDQAARASLHRADPIETSTFAPDRDAALEAAEDVLIEEFAIHDDEQETLDDGSVGYSTELSEFFERVEMATGDLVVEQGARSDDLYVVVDGTVSVVRSDRDGREIRLRTLQPGAIIGEIGFLTDQPRTATVRADTRVELLVLSQDAHDELRRERPDLAIELYDRVLRGTADRAAAIHDSLTQALR
jgi:SulP family sulfate permease